VPEVGNFWSAKRKAPPVLLAAQINILLEKNNQQSTQNLPQIMRLLGLIMSSMVMRCGFFGFTMSIIWHSTSWNWIDSWPCTERREEKKRRG
jgi:hypothetical protein